MSHHWTDFLRNPAPLSERSAFLATVDNNPSKANKELRKHLPPFPLSGPVSLHALLAHLSPRKIHTDGPLAETSKVQTRYPRFSRDGARSLKAVLIKSPMWQGNALCLDLRRSMTQLALPADVSSVRKRLALRREGFVQFLWRLMKRLSEMSWQRGSCWTFNASASLCFRCTWWSWSDLWLGLKKKVRSLWIYSVLM